MRCHHWWLVSSLPISVPRTQQGQVITERGLQGLDSLISINYSLCAIQSQWKGEMGRWQIVVGAAKRKGDAERR